MELAAAEGVHLTFPTSLGKAGAAERVWRLCLSVLICFSPSGILPLSPNFCCFSFCSTRQGSWAEGTGVAGKGMAIEHLPGGDFLAPICRVT